MILAQFVEGCRLMAGAFFTAAMLMAWSRLR
jgi:hypothetical protein